MKRPESKFMLDQNNRIHSIEEYMKKIDNFDKLVYEEGKKKNGDLFKYIRKMLRLT